VQSDFYDDRTLRRPDATTGGTNCQLRRTSSIVGELATSVIAPAVANAFYHASEQRFDRLPLWLPA